MATTANLNPTPRPKHGRPTQAWAWGTDAPDQPLRPMDIERRALRPDDVAIRITHAGICHSDLHTCRNDWGGSRYPMIPGHEIVGGFTAVGHEVTRHRVGDRVAVGCMVDSCLKCDQCHSGHGRVLPKAASTFTTARDRHDGSRSPRAATPIISSSAIISCCKCPTASTSAASRLCSAPASRPIRRSAKYRVGPDQRVGVVGLGGLGHMGVKFAPRWAPMSP